MKIICIGGGVAGLYFAISMKLRNPAHEILVMEKNPRNFTKGWGVILPDKTVDKMKNNDPESGLAIQKAFFHLKNIAVNYKNKQSQISGYQFSAIGRLQLLNILQHRAEKLGVKIYFNQEEYFEKITSSDADLIIAADGARSKVREYFSSSCQVQITYHANKYIWLGTTQKFQNTFSFFFEQTEQGWIWAHCYQFSDTTATFLIECSQETWNNLGLSGNQSIAICEGIFAKYLDGHPLLEQRDGEKNLVQWINFPLVKCKKWYFDKMILMGDAAHTTHFSIGSGTRLAVDDAMTLANLLNTNKNLSEVLSEYQSIRQTALNGLLAASLNSMYWFENLENHTSLCPEQFTYSLLTRSRRITHESIRLRDKFWADTLESWFERRSVGISSADPILPVNVPLKLKDIWIKNRIVSHIGNSFSNDLRTRIGLSIINPEILFKYFLKPHKIANDLKKMINEIRSDNFTQIGIRLNYESWQKSPDIKRIFCDWINLSLECEINCLELKTGIVIQNLHLLQEIRELWPHSKPVLLDISISDIIQIENLKKINIDVISIYANALNSRSGNHAAKGILTLAMDKFSSIDEMNTVIMAGLADLCLIG